MTGESSHSRLRGAAAAAAFVAACFLVAGMGSAFTTTGPGAWYATLQKPAFTPPGWLFGPVWTCLYFCMGLAAWLVWRKAGFRRGALPMGLFAAQLVLNAAWTPLFFGLQNPGAAFADIVALWLAIVLTTWAFFKVSRPAGWLMAPYLAWVSFAAVLNLSIWRLNVYRS